MNTNRIMVSETEVDGTNRIINGSQQTQTRTIVKQYSAQYVDQYRYDCSSILSLVLTRLSA